MTFNPIPSYFEGVFCFLLDICLLTKMQTRKSTFLSHFNLRKSHYSFINWCGNGLAQMREKLKLLKKIQFNKGKMQLISSGDVKAFETKNRSEFIRKQTLTTNILRKQQTSRQLYGI